MNTGPRKKKWEHSRFPGSYCFERHNRVHLSVFGKRFALKPALQWTRENKEIALSILFNHIQDYYSDKMNSETKTNSLFELMNQYIGVAKSNMNPTSFRKVKSIIRKLITKEIELDNAAEIRSHIISNLSKYNWANNTKRKYLKVMRTMFQFAVDVDLIAKNPILKTMVPNEKRKIVVAFSRDEVNKIIDYFYSKDKIELALLVKFIGLSGVRINECMKLEWRHIDFDNDYIHIEFGKGSEQRKIPISNFDGLLEVLNELKLLNPQKLFTWKSPTKPQMHVRDAVNDLKFAKKLNFHGIRKMRENELIKVHHNKPQAVAQVMGHSPNVQNKHYLEYLSQEELKEIFTENRAKNVQNNE